MVKSPITVVLPPNVVDPETPNEPVLRRLPDIIALPVNGNTFALSAYDDVTA
jgi:hypothetical protein